MSRYSSQFVEERNFLCNSDPSQIVASFIETLENLVSQSKAKMKNFFLDLKTTINFELGSILEKITQGHIRREPVRFDMSHDDCDGHICASTQFLQIQRNKILDLQGSLER